MSSPSFVSIRLESKPGIGLTFYFTFFSVVFRSKRNQKSRENDQKLYEADAKAHREAITAGGVSRFDFFSVASLIEADLRFSSLLPLSF